MIDGKTIVKNIQSAKHLFTVYTTRERRPLNVTHIITTRCNYRCVYCSMPLHNYKEMTTPQIFSLIDQMVAAGVRRYGLSGGEPLLRDDIGDVINYAKSKGMIVTLFTNGFFVKKKIEELKNLDVLLISFDGGPSVHDLHRHPGAYDKVMEAITIAQNHKIPVWIGFTLTKHSINQVDFILEKSRELGFKILVQPVFNYPGYSTDKGVIDGIQEFGESFREAVQKFIDKKKQGYPVLSSYTYLKNMKNPYAESVPHWNRNTCWATRTFCALTPDGRVSPCFKVYNLQQWPDATQLGFVEALNAVPKFPEFRCGGCYSYATTEFSYLYSLYLEVMYNTFTTLLHY